MPVPVFLWEGTHKTCTYRHISRKEHTKHACAGISLGRKKFLSVVLLEDNSHFEEIHQNFPEWELSGSKQTPFLWRINHQILWGGIPGACKVMNVGTRNWNWIFYNSPCLESYLLSTLYRLQWANPCIHTFFKSTIIRLKEDMYWATQTKCTHINTTILQSVVWNIYVEGDVQVLH